MDTMDTMTCGCTYSTEDGWTFTCNTHRGMNRRDAALDAATQHTPDDDVPPNGIPFQMPGLTASPDIDDGRTGAPDDSAFRVDGTGTEQTGVSAPAWRVEGTAHGAEFSEIFASELEATEYASEIIDGDVDATVELERIGSSVTAEQLRRRGYAVWTSPAASLEADRRARDASRLEAGYSTDGQTLTRDHSSAYAQALDRQYRGQDVARGW